jgi:hypothetical protein
MIALDEILQQGYTGQKAAQHRVRRTLAPLNQTVGSPVFPLIVMADTNTSHVQTPKRHIVN